MPKTSGEAILKTEKPEEKSTVTVCPFTERDQVGTDAKAANPSIGPPPIPAGPGAAFIALGRQSAKSPFTGTVNSISTVKTFASLQFTRYIANRSTHA
jgi:hypothetical protein